MKYKVIDLENEKILDYDWNEEVSTLYSYIVRNLIIKHLNFKILTEIEYQEIIMKIKNQEIELKEKENFPEIEIPKKIKKRKK